MLVIAPKSNLISVAPTHTWVSGKNSFLYWHAADVTNTADDPKLVVVHGASGGGSSSTNWATTTLQSLNYTYDAVGNITKIIDLSGTRSAGTTTYEYDGLYRLTRASTTQATTTDWVQTYTYNDVGNILTKSDVGSYSYAGTGWANPHAPTTINGVSYSYDNAGNQTSAGSMSLSWDPWNRLSYTSLAGTTTGYTYDQSGQRVTQAIKYGAGATTTTTYWNKLYQTAGATTTLYIFVGDTLLATVEGNGVATSTYVTHTDHLNSTNVMSDKNGNLSQLATFYPYGALRNNELPSNGFRESRLFIGQVTDQATLLNFLQARYQDGTRGQFISQDPMFLGMPDKQTLSDPQQLNSYSYARNNPVNLSDPSGQFATLPLAAVGAGVGAIGGFAGQYFSNVNADLAQGMGWRSLYGNFSWEKTERYGSSMAMGATAGFVTGACVGLCSGAVAVAVGVGGAFSGSMLKDSADYYYDKNVAQKPVTFNLQQSVETGLTNAAISVATAGLVKTVPQVRGADISTFGKAALTGAHTQAKLATEGIIQALTSIVASLRSIVTQMQASQPAR